MTNCLRITCVPARHLTKQHVECQTFSDRPGHLDCHLLFSHRDALEDGLDGACLGIPPALRADRQPTRWQAHHRPPRLWTQ